LNSIVGRRDFARGIIHLLRGWREGEKKGRLAGSTEKQVERRHFLQLLLKFIFVESRCDEERAEPVVLRRDQEYECIESAFASSVEFDNRKKSEARRTPLLLSPRREEAIYFHQYPPVSLAPK